MLSDVQKRWQGDSRKRDRRLSPRGVSDLVVESPRRLPLGWGVGAIKVCRRLLLLWRDFATLPLPYSVAGELETLAEYPPLLDMGPGSRAERDSNPRETCIRKCTFWNFQLPDIHGSGGLPCEL
jgi:hypothetical protein